MESIDDLNDKIAGQLQEARAASDLILNWANDRHASRDIEHDWEQVDVEHDWNQD